MEVIPKNKLSHSTQKTIHGLKTYLDRSIYYYGSVLRPDYVDGESDVDILVFSDNIDSTLSQICQYLRVDRDDVKKTIWHLNQAHLIHGYKLQYSDANKHVNIEISVFNERNQKEIIDDHLSVLSLPAYILYLLYIVKFLHYRLHLISKPMYNILKRFIMGEMMGRYDENNRFFMYTPRGVGNSPQRGAQ
jgi:hypothetical protein